MRAIVEQGTARRKLAVVLGAIWLAACPNDSPPVPDPGEKPPSADKASAPAPTPPRGDGKAPVGATTCQRALGAQSVVYEPTTYRPRRATPTAKTECHLIDPILLSGTIHGVDFVSRGRDKPSRMLVACDLAIALARLATQARTQGIRRVFHAGTTHCRTIRDTETLSQHAFGMAIDITALETDEGRMINLAEHWEHDGPWPKTAQGKLLRSFARRLHDDQVFNIVLTPEYDVGHRDHLHLDLTPGRHFLSRGPTDLLLGD
jgi:hypothetical protein